VIGLSLRRRSDLVSASSAGSPGQSAEPPPVLPVWFVGCIIFSIGGFFRFSWRLHLGPGIGQG